MNIHPQVITKNNFPEFIVLPYKEYEALLLSLEDKEDLDAIREYRASDEPMISFELLQKISKGDHAVRVFREHKKISQAQLAKKADISRQYLCQIENRERKGSGSVLKKIAKILDVDVDLLIS